VKIHHGCDRFGLLFQQHTVRQQYQQYQIYQAGQQRSYQITIYYNNPLNISLSNLTFPIIPEHRFKNIDEARKADRGFIPVGTGPYRIEDYNELSHIILKANESYHGSAKPTNTLRFQIFPEKRDAINLMDVNNISVTFSKELDRDTIYSNKDVNVINFPSNEVELIGF
jgi:peptide/nickel transport system substrate-binding protein